MRTLIIATVAFGLIATATSADTMKNCGAAWSAMPADANALSRVFFHWVHRLKDHVVESVVSFF